jgi:hypothetical protein
MTPRRLLSLTSPDLPGTAVFMMRTKGIRDLAIGAGTVAASTSASDEDSRRWLFAGLGSDTLDAGVALLSWPSIGGVEALFFAGTAAAFTALDRWALRALGSASDNERAALADAKA